MSDFMERLVSSIRSSQILRLFLLGFLVLLLLIPVAMIGRLVSERRERQEEAVADVSAKWGRAQAITGPALVVPYTHRWTETPAGGPPVVRTETRNAIFLPEALAVRGVLDAEVRSRGIFDVPVYRLDLVLEGEFERPSFAGLGVEPEAVHWERAHLAVGISDARAIREETSVAWNGDPVPFLPGIGAFAEGGAGIHADVGVAGEAGRLAFSFPLALNGSSSVTFVPFAQKTVVEIRADYGHPSFQGNWLPSERSVSGEGFEAAWSIPSLGRGYPQAWRGEEGMREAIDGSRFGVELKSPIDPYRMAERSVKYAGVFLLLTFAAVWVVEVLAGLRAHPIQYLLLGAALCLFYLLELSLSEHLGFPGAYAIASVAVVAMVAGYAVVMLRRAGRALVVAGGVAVLYGYLYVLLRNEDHALLIGSIGLFVILAAVMYATRRVDWHAAGSGSQGPPARP